MFILLFGILGVAALFPVGHFHASQAQRVDHGSALGEAAFRDLYVRGLLNPSAWRTQSGGALPANWRDMAFAVDPYGMTRAVSTPAQLANFPYGSIHSLTRLTTVAPGSNPPVSMGPALAEAIFQSDADISVQMPAAKGQPAQQFIGTDARAYQGDFTWMYTVFPVQEGNSQSSQQGSVLYRVAVVVIHKRDVTQEWIAQNADINSTTSGGTARLFNSDPEPLDLLRPGEWVLLAQAARTTSAPKTPVFRWYRISSVSTTNTAASPPRTSIDIFGYDWLNEPEWNNNGFAFADFVVIPGAIAVYEKVLRLNDAAAWGAP